jgi:uncharacterized protein (DUF697 family)
MATESAPAVQSKTVAKKDVEGDGAKEAAKKEGLEAAAAAGAETKADVKALEPAERLALAQAIIKRNVLWALGAGLLPLPILDMVLATGVQVKMLAELSALYDTKFSEAAVKKTLVSLASSIGGVAVGTAVGASIAKLIPAIGTTLGVVTVPIIVGAFTYAAGNVFVLHFETGGTVLDFDAAAMRAHFLTEFERAKVKVTELQKEKPAA